MKFLNGKLKQNKKLTMRVFMVIIFSGILGVSYIDFKYNDAFAQALQELCTPDRGINTSQSNCFSNAQSQPVYNSTNTNNVRPPPEIGPTYANETN
ncbi:MAG: hypothetical protein AB7U98_13910 [Candidatus Nitrosocosmicus sp.]|jgi:hypothetical protein|uniref:hypothetical protein n=1 Tax=Candidatus Nitrosocosmicus sp. FF01 TaxID=3397670 RepID=UPI002A734CDC|nr:hypothetical protein [Candidatus Nitrosocosmicus sp.]GKS62619.1 hypothetical protein YTPLAS21_20770 [Candidatus Nitrosocosmicus sp.]